MNSRSEHLQEQASLYVAGALTPEEQHAFEADMRDHVELRDLVRSLQPAAELVALAAPRAALPPGLKDKILKLVETPASANVPAPGAPIPGFRFHGAGDPTGWKELPVRGAWIKLLSIDPARGYAVLMGKLEAGVRYPAHTHIEAEQLYIVTGDLHIGDRALGPGDFHHADAGTSHPVNYSIEGCTLLAVLPADHELVQFAMA
jgi:anti-sigma factor ChrR (cupin superfamily)